MLGLRIPASGQGSGRIPPHLSTGQFPRSVVKDDTTTTTIGGLIVKQALYGIILLLTFSSSQAALLSQLSGQAYFDTVLNITWLADANLAATNTFGVSGIGSGGLMSWDTAQSWIAAMNTATYLGFTDWRLPTSTQPDSNCSGHLGNLDYGTGCIASEMPHLYNLNGISSGAPSPFQNVIQNDPYWTSTACFIANYRCIFSFGSGVQDAQIRNQPNLHAWAVRTGSAVPIPAAAWLFGGALGLLGVARRRSAA